jgi:hypothetical protein
VRASRAEGVAEEIDDDESSVTVLDIGFVNSAARQLIGVVVDDASSRLTRDIVLVGAGAASEMADRVLEPRRAVGGDGVLNECRQHTSPEARTAAPRPSVAVVSRTSRRLFLIFTGCCGGRLRLPALITLYSVMSWGAKPFVTGAVVGLGIAISGLFAERFLRGYPRPVRSVFVPSTPSSALWR